MSDRVKLVIATILLLVALGAAAFATVATIQAIQRFRHERELAAAGDVSTIRPWMTIPYIAHAYHVPEAYLYTSLHVTGTSAVRHATLRELAASSNRSLDELIHDIQKDIVAYRKQHPRSNPTPTGQLIFEGYAIKGEGP